MVSVLILEDEYYTREYLKELVSKNPLVSKVFDVSSGSEAVKVAEKYRPDVALLDIELNTEEELNGIEVAKIIYNLNPKTYFVFITGYSKYAVDSFQVHPYDYILKPFKRERVMEVIAVLTAKALGRKDVVEGSNRIRIRIGDEILFVEPKDIIFIEKQDKTTLIHTVGNVYKVDKTLGELEEVLQGNFLRVHKSFIVNVDKIRKVREVSRRSYEIEFYDYDRTAQMSRYKFEEYKDICYPSLRRGVFISNRLSEHCIWVIHTPYWVIQTPYWAIYTLKWAIRGNGKDSSNGM